MKHKLTKEEEALRQKLEQADFQYQESDWLEVESRLKSSQGGWGKYGSILKGAAALVVISAAVYLLSPQGEATSTEKSKTVAEKAISNTKTETQVIERNKTEEVEQTLQEEPLDKTQKDSKDQVVEKRKKENIAVEETPKTEVKIDEQLQANNSINKPETPKPNVKSQLSGFTVNGKICQHEKVNIMVKTQDSKADKSIKWFINGSQVKASSNSLSINLEEAKNYTIKAVLTDLEGSIVSTIDTILKVNAVPEVNFTYEDQDGIFTDFTAKFEAEPTDLKYQWYVEDKLIGESENGNFTYDFISKGIYDVSLVLTTAEGCQSSKSKPVSIQADFGPFINAFTPNGDNLNDTFIPKAFNNFNGNFKFIVYNLNGQLIYQSDSQTEPWNGRRDNVGEMMKKGIYVWKVMVSDNKGNQRTFTDRVEIKSF